MIAPDPKGFLKPLGSNEAGGNESHPTTALDQAKAELAELEARIAPLQAQVDQLTRQFWVTKEEVRATKSKFEKLVLIKPPFPLQQQFAEIVQKYGRLRAQQREAERQAEHLFQSLLHRAFWGVS